MSDYTFGLMIAKSHDVCGYKVTVHVMMREGTASHPLNCTGGSISEPDVVGRADLCLDGWVSDYDGKFHLNDPSYPDRYRVELRDAKAMAAMLDKIAKAIAKEEAREAGDVFMAFAKAVGAQWVCEARNERYSSYSDTSWYWWTIAQGREKFRRAIAEQEVAHAERHGTKRAAA